MIRRYYSAVARADEELESREIEDNERGTEQWDAQVVTRLGEADRRALDEIVAALHRISDGTFGICEGCGDRISKARLEAMPTARTCIRCALAH